MLKLNSHSNNSKSLNIALIGEPNSGKSTLFNCLTGSNQHIGNWPGVTVEQKIGKYIDKAASLEVKVVDLPGCYSLIATSDLALDEQVTCKYILEARDTVYINVIDASHLSRDLYLSLQLLELGLPVIVALNCTDLAIKAGLEIDVQILSKYLGCPVVPIVAKTAKNTAKLKQQIAIIAKQGFTQQNSYQADYPKLLDTALDVFRPYLSLGEALHLLEGDILLESKLTQEKFNISQIRSKIAQQIDLPLDLFIAKHRRELVTKILYATVIKQSTNKFNITENMDYFALHKIYGPLIFIGSIYLLFTLAMNGGGILQTVFDQISEIIFVRNFSQWLITIGIASWLVDILANGLGRGLNITLTFVPVLAVMFFCLGVLESSGYMMRAAFIVDRLMRLLGLSGRAFIPLIVGFGCNVPAVMSARTLANRRERILTIMMTPFMSCSARLAIYAIFVTAFFPVGGQHVIFSLYLIGILVAVLTALALRTKVLAGETSISIMELPDYRWPPLSSLLRQVWYRLKSFLIKAGALIILLCVLINGLGTATLEKIGKTLTPAFAPIGISADNWPATVGLVTGLIAKEAVIGTLNSVYKQTADTDQDLTNSLVQSFGEPIAAYAYLLFSLLYFPCASVVAVIAKELNKKWALFSVIWSTGLAYIIAALFYKIATWSSIISASTVWVSSLLLVLAGFFMAARWIVSLDQQRGSRHKLVSTPVTLLG